jgi:siderophore synthetase component
MRIYPDDFSAETTRDAGPTVIQTNLYDLIDAIGEEVELDERALIPDIVMHVLRAHRVTSPGPPQRMAGAL